MQQAQSTRTTGCWDCTTRHTVDHIMRPSHQCDVGCASVQGEAEVVEGEEGVGGCQGEECLCEVRVRREGGTGRTQAGVGT